MASQFSRQKSSRYESVLRRNKLRRVLLETLERRELLAADSAGAVFAQGTPQDYVDTVIEQYLNRASNSGEDSGQSNLQGTRWENPVGGASPNLGDPAEVTWSIVPDGTTDSANNSTTNLVAFMDNIYGGGSGPVEQRPWFNIFQRAYDRWGSVSGLNFVYEPADDGAPMGGTNRGVAGVRGDVRIGGRNIDGNFGVLAFNYFPNNGGNGGFDGDMIIDTNDVWYFNNADAPTGENRGLFNVLMHEAGHGIGLGHVIPVNQTKLMEPFISLAYSGAQHDDILGAHELYGDDVENDDLRGTATDLGTIGDGNYVFRERSINDLFDEDWTSFTVDSAGEISLTLEPVGEQYDVGPQGGGATTVNSLLYHDLEMEVQASDGTVLAQLNMTGLGEAEQLMDFPLPAGGTYYLRVTGFGGAPNPPQLYDLTMRLDGFSTGTPQETPPRLLSVAPNIGEIFSFNRTNDLDTAPTELTFRFDGGQFLDPASLDGIRITRSGFDDDFTDGDEVVIAPGFVGFGDSRRIMVARFASPLPDDLYRVEVFGVDIPSEGITAVRNTNGTELRPRVEGTDRDTLLFDLELGNQIVAVVPQPTSRDANTGVITQNRDQIEVYFSEGDLLHPVDVATGDVAPNPTVVEPAFYRLFADRGTIGNIDDALFLPMKVEYFADRNMALLTFDQDLDLIDGTGDLSFRLRVGTNELRPSAPAVVPQGTDPGSTFDVVGNADLGVLSAISSLSVSETIVNAGAFPLDFPGAPDTPGSREVVDDPGLGESHFLGDAADAGVGLGVQFYNFNKVDPVFTDAATGQPVFSSISPAQEQRFREVFELFGSYLGIQFVETLNQGWTLGVANIDGPSGVLGQAGGGLVTMDAAESWNDEFGANDDPSKISFFGVGMHEVGHLLGLGHSTELPPGTIMGGFYSDVTLGGEPQLLSGNPVEPVYPGPLDVVNGQYLHRPDSRDIDMYRFEVAAGSAGEFSAEIIAERLKDSSLLDSVLTLYRERPDGSREVIAVNDDYFSEDSYIRLDLQPGIYYLGVSASGNTDYNPEIIDSGLGGTTEGNYRLRTTFRPLEASSIVDVEGSALDGDADGQAGGVFNFWFNANSPANTVFVEKSAPNGGAGTINSPFNSIPAAFAAAQPGDIVRIVPNPGADGDLTTPEDNLAFEVGTGGLGNQPLSDGATMNVPKGVTVMIDAGVLFKMGRSVIGVGSSTSSGDRSQANLQVLGTPEQDVLFTSYTDQNLGVDTDPLETQAKAGDWGGIIYRNELDRAEGRFDSELDGRFVNYVGFANMQFGGGQVPVDGQNAVIAPLHMVQASPTLINNQITRSAFAAISADPNSFEESTFNQPRFQSDALFTPDYRRVGPEIHGNTLLNNSLNGLFVRVETPPGQPTRPQTVSARWDDTDIVHIVADTLTIAGTPGGPLLETVPPELAVVNIADGGLVAGGTLAPGTTYFYRMTFMDANGNESVASTPTQGFTVPGGSNAIRLSDLPSAPNQFVARRIYRSDDGGATYRLVTDLDRSSTVYVDSAPQRGTLINNAGQLNRARLDANLVVDPGLTVKLQNGRIVSGIGAQLIAEGREGLPVIFTSRQDDRFGAGGTFDTNSDGANTTPQPGDWGGLFFGHAGRGSLDNALVTFGGGVTSVGGTFAGFNAIEVHQADVRIANSTIENNASGVGGTATTNREGAGFNEAAAIFVRGSQPIVVDNVIRFNEDAAISIDPVSLSGKSVKDTGRSTGLADRREHLTENKGPMFRNNALGGNDTNGLVIRGATLNGESVWDDTDIVHVVFDEILIPDLYVFGGLRMQSRPNESLVVKFGPGAGITSNGRPLDIDDRIGGTLQVVGAPGFPVVLTSIADDTIGTGFDPEGRSQTDTNNDSNGSIAGPGDWRSLRIDEFSNDRNVAIQTELEPAQSTGAGVNGVPSSAQNLGLLATGPKASDDNLRNGYTVVGAINNIDDVDVYSFTGTAGTQVWFDIDRTNISLDAVIELIDSDGNIIAQSDNSLDESTGALGIFADPARIDPAHVNPMQTNALEPRNGGSGPGALGNTFADLYSTNPLDPGMRVLLPGASGSTNTYFLRIRSSNIDSRDGGVVRADLQDPSKLADGKTEGQYQLQIRLQSLDEFAGSSVSFADIRYASTGLEILGGPYHSPLVGEAVELVTNNDTLGSALDLGNLLNTDQAALSIAGSLSSETDVDWYRFDVNEVSLQSSGLTQHLAAMIDVDYADGLGRANTSLWLFYDDQNDIGSGNNTGIRLVNFGTDSNIADDIGAPLEGADTDDLSRGTAGILDAFIGTTHLPSGTYYLAITSNAQVSGYLDQYFTSDAGGNALMRSEPINSVVRVIEDRFGGSTTTGAAPLQVGFEGNANQVPYTLGDVPLFVSQRGPGADVSRLIQGSAITGDQISLISQFAYVEDIAIRGDGTLHGARVPQTGVINDANSGGILTIDTAGDGTTVATTATSGIQTFELDFSANPPTVQQALTPGTGGQRQGVGMEFKGLTYPQEGNTQFLYAVGSRGDGSTSFATFFGDTDARNYVYKLDPTSLQAVSSPQADRQNNARIGGAGTQIRERGYIDTSIDVNPNNRAQSVTMSDASSFTEPSLLDGDQITLVTPNGTTVFEWQSAVLSASLIADTSPQTDPFGTFPQNYYRDGMSFEISDGVDTLQFEVDSGPVLFNTFGALNGATYDTATFTLTDQNANTLMWEFDSNNNIANAGAIRIVIDNNTTRQTLTDAIIAAINNGNASVADPVNFPWTTQAFHLPGFNGFDVTHRISLTGDTAVGLSPENSTFRNPVLQDAALANTFGPLGVGETYDGSTFTVTDDNLASITFEFDTDNAITAGNSRIAITGTETRATLTQKIINAVNNPDAGVVFNLPGSVWVGGATQFQTANYITFLNYRTVTGSAETATNKNPVRVVGDYGQQLDSDVPVAIEEFYTNLDDNQVFPNPSTPGAMDELVAAIDGAAFTVDAQQFGLRLALNNATTADFTEAPTILLNTGGTPGVVVLPFNFNHSANVLNNTLFNAVQAVEPGALLMTDGHIWVPGQSFFSGPGTNDRLDPPAPSYNTQLSKPGLDFFGNNAYVTGLAFTGTTMWGVSETGDLYRVGGTAFSPNSTFNNGDYIETIYNTATQSRVQFVSLTSGPRNSESALQFAEDAGDLGLDDILFGLDSGGVLYAFDTLGRPAHLFEDGAWFINTDAASPAGVAFSNLDVNLWHTTQNNRNNDPGHGVNISFDGSRRTQEQGADSLYFGFEDPNDPQIQVGDWSGVNNPLGNFPGYDATREDTYDFPGGVEGSVISNVLDLSSYGPGDKPMLYFNYYLQTEDANADNPGDNNFMKDAFRVSVAGDNGDWQLLGSNNSQYDAPRLVGQFDEHDYPFLLDPFALTRQVSELFDAGVGGAPDSWRQARIDLSRFAGEENVRIRFDFSSAGSFDLGATGAKELVAVPGKDIREGDLFQISGVNFEFDLGLVLQIPSGGRLTAGEFFEVDGTTYTFSTASNAGTNVLFAPTDTADVIAARIAAKINNQGLTANIDPDVRSRISVIDAVNTTPAVSASLPANFISDVPGANNGVGVLIHSAMTAAEVRDAIRVSLAATFNVPGQEQNLDVIRFNENTIYLWNKTIDAAGPLGAATTLQGDIFGERTSGPTNNVGLGAQRGQNNRFEGVYIDDIIVGFAERGEMVTYTDNSTPTDTSFSDNPRHEPTPNHPEIETGTYQIEIRKGATYGIGGPAFPNLAPILTFDTNDRHAEKVSLIAPSGAEVTDGQTFTLSDGIDIVTFEYDDTSITTGPNVGVAQGNVRVPFSSLDDAGTVALRIRDAINSPQAQAVLDVIAGLSDGTATGTGTIGKQTTSRVVHIHGNVATDNAGSANFDGTQQFTISGVSQPGFVLYGIDTFKPTEIGDENRVREQGQIIAHSNIIRDSAGYGIVVDAGARSSSIAPLAGALPHPGAVRNLVQFNQEDLAPGPVLINNLIYANAIGGILFSGDNRTVSTPDGAVPFGRIVNNTVVGIGGSGVGINVNGFASPTLLNNIVASLQTGIQVDNSSSTTVIGATTYKNNGLNASGPSGVGTDPQLLGPSEVLFVDAAGRNYYLEDGSRAIDASIDALNDRQQMTTVRDPLGIAPSPILAPNFDLTGQLRVDDPDISNPNGTGGNPFKDRGAYDRADFFGPIAIIQQPLDNDPDNIDTDRTNTNIQLDSGAVDALDFFSILLFEDQGTGPDPATVTSNAVALTENGRLLTPGIDYIFGYNPSSRLIRLTPLAGIWRNDSVYEITLNNQDGIRMNVPAGDVINDGDLLEIDAGGTLLTFEFDNDGVVDPASIAIPFDTSFSAYEMSATLMLAINQAGNGLGAYLQGDRAVMVHGATSIMSAEVGTALVGAIRDVAGHALQANRINSRTQFTIMMPEVELDYGDAPGANHRTVMTDGFGARSIDVSRHTLLPVDAPVLVLGSYVDSEADGQPTVSGQGDDVAAAAVSSSVAGHTVDIRGAAILQTQAVTPATDGQRITITDPMLQTVTFEFDTAPDPGVVTSGSIRIPVTVGETADVVADKLRAAVSQAVLDGHIEGLNAFATGNIVDLGGSTDHVFDLSAGLLVVTRLPQSDFELTFPGGNFADGDVVSVTDTLGRTLLFELDDTAGAAAGVSASNVAVPVDLTPGTGHTDAEIVGAIASAINVEIAARRLSLAPVVANGLSLVVSGDDEDGVSFGGLFNANSKPVPVTFNVTGSGILDTWFDWNGDGDFTDPGEKIDVASDLLLRNGSTTVLIDTPDIAQTTAEAFQLANPGERFFVASRFRISNDGTPLLGGVGISGEVEDYMVEIVVGAPPVPVDDTYQVLEDSVLNVSALGILANDTDPDHAVTDLLVFDEDPATPQLEVARDVDHGTLVVQADGSFVYTPDPDFYGEDTFEYNITDPRLLSEFPATVTITVQPVNDFPTAIDDEITISEDQSILRPGGDFTFNDFKGVFGTPSETNELGQDLTVTAAVILHPDPGVLGGTVTVVNNELIFTPPAQYNNEIDGPVLIELTVQDNGQTFDLGTNQLVDDFLSDTSTLTININALNDSPEYTMPATVAVDEDAGPQTVPFISMIEPGPIDTSQSNPGAVDEKLGPAINFEDQQVSFTATAQEPTLFASGPTIDASGVLTFELNPDVTTNPPFPSEILVEVLAIDTGAGGTVITNGFDPAEVAVGTSKTYDGATLTVTDIEGNVVVFELDDINLPGVGSTGGVPHAAIPYDPATDTTASIAQALADAITNPPAASIASGGAGTWAASSFVDAVTGELRVLGDASTVSAASAGTVTITNQFPALAAGESYDGATFTITDADGDAITFELNDTTDTAPATPGVTAGNVAIDYDPSFTANQLSQAISDAINNPPATILAGLTGTWDVQSALPAASDQLQLSGVASIAVTPSATPIINPLAAEVFMTLNPLVERQANNATVRTFTIVPTAINDAPEFEIPVNPIAIQEDAGPLTFVDFVINARPGPTTALDELASQQLTLTVQAVDPTAFATLPSAVLDQAAGTATLMFETGPDVNDDTGHDLTIIVTLMDDGGVVHPDDIDTTIQTLTLTVAPINDAPSFNLPVTEITVFEDDEEVTGVDPNPTVFVGFADSPVQGPATAVDETVLPPTMQQLSFITVSVSDPSLFEQQPMISPAGDLSFKTAQDQNGTAVVVVRLVDDGVGPETGNGDDNQARPDQTFTINLTPVNDPPEYTIPATVDSIEDEGLIQVNGFATDLRPGPTTATDEAGQEFTVQVRALDPAAFSVQPAIAADGTLTYQTGPNVNSLNSDLRVEVFLTDDGTPGPAPDNNTSVLSTFTVQVTPINDAPTFNLTGTQVTVIEDTEQFNGTTETRVNGFAANMVPGPASATDEATQNLNFNIISVSAPELFEVQPALSVAGDLTFKTALHQNGTAIVVAQLVDDGVGAPPPNDNTSTLQTFTITVTPINDAPEFNVPQTTTVDEDAGLTSVGGFATNVRRGPVGTDDENNQQITFEVTASDPGAFAIQPTIAADGTLSFQTAENVNSLNANLQVNVRLLDNGASTPAPNLNASGTQMFTIIVNPINDPPIADAFVETTTEDASVSILAADVIVGDVPGPTVDESNQSIKITQIEGTSTAGGTITPVFSGPDIVSFTYEPPADLVGTDTFLYVLTDNGTPARSGSGTITIQIAGINDAPQFNKGPDQVVPEDVGPISVPNWATGILAGPPAATDEHASQTVTFSVTNTNNALFDVQPAVATDGTLTYTPAANANGIAFVEITAVDDGDDTAPNVNTSAAQTFTISVNPVNDAPVFTAGPDVVVDEDSGIFSQAWATDIAPAAGLLDNPQTATDEVNQVVDFVATADRPELFSVQPSISSTGQLQFTPTTDANGVAVVTVAAVDRGPAGAQDQNTSATQTFTITVNPVNDAPTAVGDNYNANENAILAVGSPGVLVNDTDVDLPDDSIQAVAATTTSALGAVVVISQDGSISYDPSNVLSIQQLTTGQSVLDTFEYQIEDDAGVASVPATVTINVSGVDDAPIASDDAFSVGVGQSRLLDVLSNDSDIDSAIDPRTITITQIPIFGTTTVNQTGVIEYEAGPGFRGVDTFAYTVRDGAGNVSNEAVVTVTVNNAPIAVDDTTFTFKNEPVEINVLANDSDLDGSLDPSTVQVVVSPTPGGTTEDLGGGIIRFTPAVDFAGRANFSYVVADDVGTVSNVADVLVRVQNSKWQNPQGNLDVNDDGFVTPIDALIVINYLNTGGESFLPNSGVTPPPYLDPSGDESVTPIDALLIINFLNSNSSGGGGGEGEADLTSEAYVMTVTPEQIIETVGPQVVREIQEAMDSTLLEVAEEASANQGVPFIGPHQPEGESDEDEIIDALYCSRDKVQAEAVEDAVDDFFGQLGPYRPS